MSDKKRGRHTLTLDDVREIALSMPEVEEKTTYGLPSFAVGKTRFAVQAYQRPDVDPNSLGVFVSFEERDRLIASRPDLYYVTDHFGKYPAVLVRLTLMRRAELEELLGLAWRHAMERFVPARKKRRKAPSTRKRRR